MKRLLQKVIEIFSKKNTSITQFDEAIKSIKKYIFFEDYKTAMQAIEEITYKENQAFKMYLSTINDEKKKIHEIQEFEKKMHTLHKLKEIAFEKEKQQNALLAKKKKRMEMKLMEEKIIEEAKTGNTNIASDILKNFLQKYPEDIEVIEFVNKMKQKVIKIKEKQYKKQGKEIKTTILEETEALLHELEQNIQASQKKNKANENTIRARIKKYKILLLEKLKQVKQKKLLEEVKALTQAMNETNEIMAKTKLSYIHSGFKKEIQPEETFGYDIFGKILGASTFSGDIIDFHHSKRGYHFFIGDATGHGIQAGIIVTQFTQKFQELVGKKDFPYLIQEINNALKQNIKSGNFITSIFFYIEKQTYQTIYISGLGHEPIYIFKQKTKQIEKKYLGGLAAGIRLIQDILSIKIHKITLEDGDILLAFTDGLIEAKNEEGTMYGFERLEYSFLKHASKPNTSLTAIYNGIMDDLILFTGNKKNFYDDVSILLIKRNAKKDILFEAEKIASLLEKYQIGNQPNLIKKFKNKTQEEIEKAIEEIQKKNQIEKAIKHLERLYETGDILKLKQDCIRYIQEGYLHHKINFYLKKALEYENKYKIEQKEKKLQEKYTILKELYKKGDYRTVIHECINIISKDGNI